MSWTARRCPTPQSRTLASSSQRARICTKARAAILLSLPHPSGHWFGHRITSLGYSVPGHRPGLIKDRKCRALQLPRVRRAEPVPALQSAATSGRNTVHSNQSKLSTFALRSEMHLEQNVYAPLGHTYSQLRHREI